MEAGQAIAFYCNGQTLKGDQSWETTFDEVQVWACG